MRVYIAGPMSGLPQKNYPAFFAEAARLRARGYEVFSPAELWPLDSPLSWEDFMRGDITEMLKCTHIKLLPGWHCSRGARIEQDLAAKLGFKFLED